MTAKIRIPQLDSLRGIAIGLMVIDHWLVAAGETRSIVRLTVTRLSLPLFCIVAGILLKDKMNAKRIYQLILAGALATSLGRPIGIGQPDILLVLALVLAIAPVLYKRRELLVLAICFGAIQPVTWPEPWLPHEIWTGYQPGTVLVMVLAGTMLKNSELIPKIKRLPVWEFVGKFPLSFYLGHLAILAVLYR